MEDDDLETAESHKLPVPKERRKWLAIGGFYDDHLGDTVNLNFIVRELNCSFRQGEDFDVIDDNVGATYVIVDHKQTALTDALIHFHNSMQDYGCLDDTAYADAVGELIEEEWQSMDLAGRVWLLQHEDIPLGDALGNAVPDRAYEPIEMQLSECGRI